MNREILKTLYLQLAKVKKDRDFMKSVAIALDTDEKKEEMIAFLKSSEKISTSDVYRKELQINEEP